jgi:hypothetical protein
LRSWRLLHLFVRMESAQRQAPMDSLKRFISNAAWLAMSPLVDYSNQSGLA